MGSLTALLPSNASPLDIEVSRATWKEFGRLQCDLEAILDPYRTPKEFLPFVAWGEGTRLWEEDWSESTKREWAGEQTHFQARRGTRYAFERALRTMGFDLLQVVTAPQGFYASPNLSKEYWDGWIRQMPQIRIFLGNQTGHSYGDEWFVGDGAVGAAGVGRDDGWLYHGRKAVIRQNGVDTPLKTYQFQKISDTREAFSVDRVSTLGDVTLGFIVGEDFVGDDKFIGFALQDPKLLTIRLDQSYRHDVSRLQLDTVVPSLEPLTVNYERDSDTKYEPDAWFAGADFHFFKYVTPDDAPSLLADRVYLHDPNVAVPMTDGISFTDDARMGIESHTAELLIDLHMKDKLPSFYVDGYIGELFAIGEDRTYSDRAFRAIQAAKSYHDRILVSFEVIRPLTAGDTIDGTTLLGAWVRNSL